MQIKHFTVKELPISERPYEKCEQFGVNVLSDAELLAVIIRCGSKGIQSIEVAQEILSCSFEHSGLLGLHYLSMAEMMQIKGIGKVKSIQLLCIVELAKRLSKLEKKKGVSFQSPESIADYYMQDLRCLSIERLLLLMLDSKNQLIKDMVLSSGTINASFSEPREIFLMALKYNSVSVILIHNHPSGDPTPSKEDMITTNRIKEAGQLVGIKLMDHIIIGDNTYVSFRERGLI